MARHAVGRSIERIDVVRWNRRYFDSPTGPTGLLDDGPVRIDAVERVGKRVVLWLAEAMTPRYLVVHNAMTGYFDWAHEPWTFDYVEGARRSSDTDVRVRLHLSDGLELRFHDSRLFGSMAVVSELSSTAPELLMTPMCCFGAPVISLSGFAGALACDRRPVKVALLDQSLVAGIGNIYANEGCHLAGIDPRTPARDVGSDRVPILLEALRCVVLQCIPTVAYHWLKVDRRSRCGSCGSVVQRVMLAGRSTFLCGTCQV